MTNLATSKCTHIEHENGVHEFKLADSSIASYEAYLQILEPIYAQRTPDDPPLRSLFDGGKTNLPINYSMRRAKDLSDRYPNVGRIRMAILSDSMVEIRLVDSFMRLFRFPKTQLRFFAVSRRDDALAWLVKDS
ncbi:MAG: STAS/SEC14 domain-containing protein [Chloroflexota bacterium]